MLTNAPLLRGAGLSWTLVPQLISLEKKDWMKMNGKKVKKAADVLNRSTANGPTASTDEVELDVPNLGIRAKTRILDDCPTCCRWHQMRRARIWVLLGSLLLQTTVSST